MKTTIASFPSQDITAGKIANDLWIGRTNISHGEFSDWTPEINISNTRENVKWKALFYLWDITNIKKDLFDNMSAIHALVWNYTERIDIILPYYSVGTMERVDYDGQVATAKVLARLLSSTPSAKWSKPTFHSFDIHDLHERFYTNDSVYFEEHTTVDFIKNELEKMNNPAVAFPDAWAKKRFQKYFSDYEIIECIKERDWDKRYVRIKEWDAEWRNIIIVDDLVQSWGTLIKCADALRNVWANSVSAFAPHAVCPNDSHIKVADNFDTFYTTNTIPDRIEKYSWISNIEVFDMKEMYQEIIENEMGYLN